jgi:hypothetical protein
VKEKHHIGNHIDTLISKEVFKEDKKIDINTINQEEGILINIHGTRHHKTSIQKDIIKDQQLLQIGEVTTTIHGMKGNKTMQQSTIKD